MQKTTLADYQAAHFLWEAADGVALITLNRPDRKNPLTFDSYAELRDYFAHSAMPKISTPSLSKVPAATFVREAMFMKSSAL